MDSAMKKEKGPPRLALNNRAAVRRTLCRLMRLRFSGVLASETFRDLVYGANTLLQYDRTELESRIEDRLAQLEAKLNEKEATR